jgi:hypothetical protein
MFDLSDSRRKNDPAGYVMDAIHADGLENHANRYYGLYTGLVVDNKDEEKRGRCRIQVPALGMATEAEVPKGYWALPCWPGLAKGAAGQMHGLFVPPEVGDAVWVMFEHGDQTVPVYLGGWLPKDAAGTALTASGEAFRKGFKTPAGHYLRFGDKPEDLHITLAKGDGSGVESGSVITLDKDGGILLMAESGTHLAIDAKNASVTIMNVDPDTNQVLAWLTLGKDKITLANQSGAMLALDGKAATLSAPGDATVMAGGKAWLNAGKVCLGAGPVFEPAVRGMKFLAWSMIHQHMCAAPGAPSTPGPTPPPMLYKELSEVVSIG